MCKSVWKMNRTLIVTRSHPYTKEGGASGFREMRRFIKEPSEATCTVQEVRGRSSVRCCAPELACSLRL